MEILLPVGTILLCGAVGYFIVSIQEWITDMRFYRRSTQRELNRLRRSLGKVECVKHTLPDGKVETLGPGEILIFDKQKVGTITGVVGEEEMISEAERILKEARDRTID